MKATTIAEISPKRPVRVAVDDNVIFDVVKNVPYPQVSLSLYPSVSSTIFKPFVPQLLTAFPHDAQNIPFETIAEPHLVQNFDVAVLSVTVGDGFCFASIGMVGISADSFTPSLSRC